MHIIKNLLRIPLQAVHQRLNLQRDDPAMRLLCRKSGRQTECLPPPALKFLP